MKQIKLCNLQYNKILQQARLAIFCLKHLAKLLPYWIISVRRNKNKNGGLITTPTEYTISIKGHCMKNKISCNVGYM